MDGQTVCGTLLLHFEKDSSTTKWHCREMKKWFNLNLQKFLWVL